MDLSSQMRAPELGLEPRPDLADVVRGRARHVRRRQRVAQAALGLVALVGAGSLVPGLLGPSRGSDLAGPDRSYGIEDATSSVQRLALLNEGNVVAYWDDDAPCVAAVRVKRDPDCGPGVSPQTREVFPYVFSPDNPSLRIDDRQLLAGVVRPDVVRVEVALDDARRLDARLQRGEGFLLPMFSVEVPRGTTVLQVRAFGEGGVLLGERP